MTPDVTRRSLLRLGGAGAAGLAVVGVSGCQVRVGQPADKPAGQAKAAVAGDPSVAALAAGAGLLQALASLYERAAAARHDVAAALGRLRLDLTAQIAAVSALGVDTNSAATPSGATATASATSTASGAANPPTLTAARAVQELRDLERVTAHQLTDRLAAVDGPTARFLASLAASSGQRSALLAGLPAAPSPNKGKHTAGSGSKS